MIFQTLILQNFGPYGGRHRLNLRPDYPGYAKFAKLSQQEQKWGLLNDVKAIFDRRGWEQCLNAHGAELRGHRVVRRKEAD
ncbi:MAG: hypothetical protein WA939_16900 [Nodosilinea sp.]